MEKVPDLDTFLKKMNKKIILKDLNNNGQTIIIITHEDNIANQSNRIIKIKDGLIEEDNKNV